jgi:hypothetical protein
VPTQLQQTRDAKRKDMPPELNDAAADTEPAFIAELEKLGFVVVCQTSGGMEEWVALRYGLHLRAESPGELVELLSTRTCASR